MQKGCILSLRTAAFGRKRSLGGSWYSGRNDHHIIGYTGHYIYIV